MLNRTQYAVNNVQLHALEAGNPADPVILFLHGFPEIGYAWHRQLIYFAQKEFRAIAPDQRGYNRSSKPTGSLAYTLPHLTADITALIRQLTPQKIYLVGHDWGGAVAWNIAQRQPELLHKLIILNMPHLAVMHQHLRRNPAQLLRSWYTGFFQLPFVPEQLLRAFNFKALEKTLTATARPRTFAADDLGRYRAAWQQPGALTAMLNWYRAYKYSSFVAAGPVTVPTLLIWGKEDTFLGAEMALPSVAQCVDGRLEFLTDATHWLHHEQPERVNQLIADFISPPLV